MFDQKPVRASHVQPKFILQRALSEWKGSFFLRLNFILAVANDEGITSLLSPSPSRFAIAPWI